MSLAVAGIARPPRDLRLDLLRGWMQLSIFVSHVAGTVFAWGIHAAWGLSDSSEQFVLLSGLTLGSVFTLKSARDGYGVAVRDMARRTLRLWRTHLLVFCLFAAMVMAAEMWLPLPGEAARLGWSFLVERPWLALPAAAAMVYQPEFMGILPVFVWSMLLLPAFLWLEARVGAVALLPFALSYALVQTGLLRMPWIGGSGIAFDPLAWSLLFMIGALVGRRALIGGGLPRGPGLVGAAAAVVVFGLWVRLIDHGLLTGPQGVVAVMQHKEVLAPPRLLHALALAYLAAVLVPREASWMRWWPGQVLAAIGRHSLQVFCIGLFLAWMASTALARWPAAAPWLDPAVVFAGVAVLAACSLPWRRRDSATRPLAVTASEASRR